MFIVIEQFDKNIFKFIILFMHACLYQSY